ncbi:MAG: alanine racemase [Sphingorhabdus sp.]
MSANAIQTPVRLKLDGDALGSNWRALADRSGGADCGGAVKADGYGLGAREVVSRLAGAGCKDFFVAHWGEAAAIADIIPPDQIAVLNGLAPDEVQNSHERIGIPVLNTPGQVARWKDMGGARCHVMLDSGINRLGIGPEQISAGMFEGLDIDILMTHLASADEDVPQNTDQLTRFRAMASGIEANRLSIANSAGIMLGAEFHFCLTRPGLSLYGGIARAEMADFIRPVVFPEAQILQIRDLKAGDPVGYNATYSCKNDTRVATIAMGYADGYFCGFSGKGRAMVDDVELPVIGRISMDLVTLDAGNAPGLKEGDWVAIDFDLPTASATSGMSQYELLTGLGSRFERSWR